MNPTVLDAAMTALRISSEVRSRALSLLDASGAMAWPVDERGLAAHFSQKLARGSSSLLWNDLCLAFAAAHQVNPAWLALHRLAGSSLRAALSRVLPSAQAEDLEQTLFAEFGHGQTSPLLSYAGEGPRRLAPGHGDTPSMEGRQQSEDDRAGG